MLKIQTTGVDDYLDGSANIKALIIGGPGAGKTRMSSYWPRPIFLDCENGRGSLADRKMPYTEVKTSKDMLDALEYLKALERTPKAERQFQTVVVDTADSFQRIVKDEWVQQTKAQSFSGFDAWGYLDTKMQMLFTRLLNLDFNVLVLVHYKDKQYKDGENTVRELTLQLQGNISDTIFNDFGLVGWLGTYWEAGPEGRVQKRGLTFQPTPDKPFLKDRFHVTPKWMEIDFSDNDYQQLWKAFFERKEFEEFPETEVVGEIPDSERQAPAPGTVAPPKEGGPLPPRAPAELPLDKQTKEQLVETAKKMGIPVRGNTLKSEIITAIEARRNAPQAPTPTPEAPTTEAKAPTPGPEAAPTPAQETAPSVESIRAKVDAERQEPAPVDPPSQPSSPDTSQTAAADAADASPAESAPTATSSGPTVPQPQPLSPEEVARSLGAEVIGTETHDAPPTPTPATPPTQPVAKSAPQGPSACADCGKDLNEEWVDPAKKDYIRLSFVKFRRYLCVGCYGTAVNAR